MQRKTPPAWVAGTAIALFIAAVCGAPPARAQGATSTPATSETTGEQLAEVIVTAQLRKQKLIDVPASLTVFTSHDIRAAGIERPTNFIALTPGVSAVQTSEVGDLELSIRGINTGRDTEPNYALVINGVLQVNPFDLNQELANLTQIEILKGPQGAIYGLNGIAGAIIIKTKKPGRHFDADATVGYGNKNTQFAHFWIAGPLTSNISAGISGFYRKTNGFFYNSYLHCNDCADYYDEKGVAPRVIIRLGHRAMIDIMAKYSRIRAGAINYNGAFALPAFAAAFNSPNFFQNVNDHNFQYINNVVPRNVQVNKQFSIRGKWRLDLGTLTAFYAYADQREYFLTDGTSAAFNLYANVPTSVGPDVCSVSVAAEPGAPLPSPTFYANQFGPGNPGFTLLPPYSPTTCDGYQYQQRDEIDNSVEVRLTSSTAQRLQWQGGLYYANIRRHVDVSQGSDNGNGFLAQAFVPTGGPNPTDVEYNDRFRNKVWAIFGNVSYEVIPKVAAGLALRYDREQQEVSNRVGTGAQAFAQTPCYAQGPGCTVATAQQPYINPAYTIDPALATTGIPSRSQVFSQPEPKFTLTWKIRPELSVYGSYGIGFRSGGFNSTGDAATVLSGFGALRYVHNGQPVASVPSLPVASIGTCANGQNDAVVYNAQGVGTSTCGGTPTYPNGVSDTFKKEVSKAGEIGFKTELFHHRLYVSGDAYLTKVDNMQIFNFFAGPFGLLRVVTNIDRSTLKGVEGAVRWQATRYLALFGGIGTVDSRIDRYSGRPYTIGNSIPYAPKYTADAGADFKIPVSDSWAFLAYADMSAIGKTWFGPVQNNQVQTLFGVPGDFSKTYRDPYQLFNARLGMQSFHWTVTLWGRNLGDKKYLAEVIPAPEFGGSFIFQGNGRAYGVEVSYRD
ncbi:MAG: TonB-dependent receptor [Steroidobacteraceae bacterium]